MHEQVDIAGAEMWHTIGLIAVFLGIVASIIQQYMFNRQRRRDTSEVKEKAEEAAAAAALAVKHAEEAAKESKETREVIKDAVTNGPLKEAIQDAVKSALKNGH